MKHDTDSFFCRDTEASAPAEYPPEQPEADTLDDDGAAYGAEEAEMQAALEKELAETEAAAAKDIPDGEDLNMAGTEEAAVEVKAAEDDDAASEAGSEDLEAESSGSDDEDEEEEGEEADGDEDMEMADGEEKPTEAVKTSSGQKSMPQQQPEVMVH